MPTPLSLLRGPSVAPLALLVAACLLSSAVAFAAPGVVTAAQSEAHSAPFKATPVVHTFRAGDKVSADEQTKDGWRRVRLPDGRAAFVRDDELKVEASAPPPAPKPATPPFPTVPATVKVFELTARTAPSNTAPVVQTFAEGAAIAVSRDEKDGFRKVVLSEGGVAFVASAGLTLGGAPLEGEDAPPATAVAAPATAAVQPIRTVQAREPKPVIYVKDFDHLAELVKEDAVVFPMADSLATRRKAALGIMWGGGAVGAVLMVLSFTALKTQDCSIGPTYCVDQFNTPALIAGASIGCIAPLIGWAIHPSRTDLLDVVNTWNGRHVDNQFNIESHEVGQGH